MDLTLGYRAPHASAQDHNDHLSPTGLTFHPSAWLRRSSSLLFGSYSLSGFAGISSWDEHCNEFHATNALRRETWGTKGMREWQTGHTASTGCVDVALVRVQVSTHHWNVLQERGLCQAWEDVKWEEELRWPTGSSHPEEGEPASGRTEKAGLAGLGKVANCNGSCKLQWSRGKKGGVIALQGHLSWIIRSTCTSQWELESLWACGGESQGRCRQNGSACSLAVWPCQCASLLQHPPNSLCVSVGLWLPPLGSQSFLANGYTEVVHPLWAAPQSHWHWCNLSVKMWFAMPFS